MGGYACGASGGYGDRDTPEAVAERVRSTRLMTRVGLRDCRASPARKVRIGWTRRSLESGLVFDSRCGHAVAVIKELEPLHDGSCRLGY